MYQSRIGRGMSWSPFSTSARTTPAVFSGRSVSERPLRSGKVYISLWTMSVVSPTERAKSSVDSKIGVRISP